MLFSVIPAQAGIQCFWVVKIFGIPVFTGMTTFYKIIIMDKKNEKGSLSLYR
jgi:hypothetical protein